MVTVMVSGNSIVTVNAGDSRAVIGSLKSNNYKIQREDIEAKALSIEENDRTWYSK